MAGKRRVAAPFPGGAGGGFTARRSVIQGSLHRLMGIVGRTTLTRISLREYLHKLGKRFCINSLVRRLMKVNPPPAPPRRGAATRRFPAMRPLTAMWRLLFIFPYKISSEEGSRDANTTRNATPAAMPLLPLMRMCLLVPILLNKFSIDYASSRLRRRFSLCLDRYCLASL